MFSGRRKTRKSVNKDVIVLDDEESSSYDVENYSSDSLASLSSDEDYECTDDEQLSEDSISLSPIVGRHISYTHSKKALSYRVVEAWDEGDSLECTKTSEWDEEYKKFVADMIEESDVRDVHKEACGTVPVAGVKFLVDDVKDPHYALFLANLREDGKSYALKIVGDDGTSELLKYEPGDGSSGGSRCRIGEPKNYGSGKSQSFYPHELELVDRADEDYQEYIECLENDGQNVDSAAVMDETYTLYLKLHGKDTDLVDSAAEIKDEQDDLTTGHGKNARMVYSTTAHGRTVACKEIELHKETSSDSEVLIIDMATCVAGHTPFVTSKEICYLDEDDGPKGAAAGAIRSQFRKNLLILLGKPYSQHEYDDLRQKLTEQKPKECDRMLHSRVVSYKVDQLSKSYLDQHSDLAERIRMAKGDRRRVLNLLRGFFYWLENTAQNGAFRPWLDPECLYKLPQW